jgi:hypothetical protein
LSQTGRLLLIKTYLASIPIYLLSLFKFPHWAIDLINSHMANCFWDDYEGYKKLHLVNWHLICMKKQFGGLGVPCLKDLNLCLLGSWVKRFIRDEDKLWKKLVEKKYCNHENIFYADNGHASPFWKGVILAAQAVKLGYRWLPGNGRTVKFWEDTWFGTTPLAMQFCDLYCICNEKTKTVAEVWVDNDIRLSFRRNFSASMGQMWEDLSGVVEQVQLNEDSDSLVWGYEKSGVYSTQSYYAIISFRGVTPVFLPAIWNIVVPPKIHFFLWLLAHNKLATVDNLNKKVLNKPVQCCFCSEDESISHLFFECVVAKTIWKMMSEILGFEVGGDYLSVASKWIHKNKCYGVNIFTSAVLRAIWLTRNRMIFDKQVWLGVNVVLRKFLFLIMEWRIIFKEDKMQEMMLRWSSLEELIQAPLRIENA